MFVASERLGLSAKLLCIPPAILVAGAVGTAGYGLSYFRHWFFLDDDGRLKSPRPIKFLSRANAFDTQNIRSYKDAVNLKPAECIKAFFPGIDFSRPTRSHFVKTEETTDAYRQTQNTKPTPIPSLTTYAITGDKVGCSISKLVHEKKTHAFIYRTETTIKNRDTGFLASLVTTNLKEAKWGDYELWTMFLKRDGTTWRVASSIVLHGQWNIAADGLYNQSNDKYENAFLSRPSPFVQEDGHKWFAHIPKDKILALPGGEIGLMEKSECHISEVQSQNCYRNHVAKVWIHDSSDKSGSQNHEAVAADSNLRYVLMRHFAPSQNSDVVSGLFVDSQLDAKGKWFDIDQHCRPHTSVTDFSRLQYSVKALCFPHREQRGL